MISEVEQAAHRCRQAYAWYRSVVADVREHHAAAARAARRDDTGEVHRLRELIALDDQARRHALVDYGHAVAALHRALVVGGRGEGQATPVSARAG